MIRLEIVNDGTGTPEIGNYDVSVTLPSKGQWTIHRARVEGFERSRGWSDLAIRAVVTLEPVVEEAES